jgi:hypothetical protein
MDLFIVMRRHSPDYYPGFEKAFASLIEAQEYLEWSKHKVLYIKEEKLDLTPYTPGEYLNNLGKRWWSSHD